MATVEITFERGLRIWWSYTWRTFVLLAPVVILMLYLLPGAPTTAPPAGDGAHPGDPMTGPAVNPLMLMVIMAANIILQVQALRWMLKTRWREFRLEAVAASEDSTAGQ